MSLEKPTKTELIAEAKRLHKENGGPLSRDYFRSNSPFRGRWGCCYNTFPEFMSCPPGCPP